MERIIINEHAAQYEREISRLREYTSQVNEAMQRFEAQTGYSPNLTDIKEVINAKKAVSLTSNLEASLDRQLDRLKIVSKVIRDNMKSNTAPIIKDFVYQISCIVYNNAGLYSHNLSMKEGKLILTEDEAEKIRDSFRNYVETERAKEFYDLHKAAEKSLNDFFSFMTTHTRLTPFNIADYFALFVATGRVECEEIVYEDCILKEQPADI